MAEHELWKLRETFEPSSVISGLVDPDLDWILDGAETLQFDSNDVVLKRGTPSNHVLIVLRGLLVVETEHSRSGTIAMGRIEPGDLLGEIGVLQDAPRTATVKVLEPSELLKIPQPDFLALLVAHPALAIRVLGVVTDRLSRLTDRIGGIEPRPR